MVASLHQEVVVGQCMRADQESRMEKRPVSFRTLLSHSLLNPGTGLSLPRAALPAL